MGAGAEPETVAGKHIEVLRSPDRCHAVDDSTRLSAYVTIPGRARAATGAAPRVLQAVT